MAHPVDDLDQVVDVDELLLIQNTVKEVYVDDLIKEYIVAIPDASRRHEAAYLGASPRARLGFSAPPRRGRSWKARDYVTPDDVKALAVPVLAHRIIVNPASRMRDVSGDSIVQQILNEVPVPGARPRDRVRTS